jgi:hypothetical protein
LHAVMSAKAMAALAVAVVDLATEAVKAVAVSAIATIATPASMAVGTITAVKAASTPAKADSAPVGLPVLAAATRPRRTAPPVIATTRQPSAMPMPRTPHGLHTTRHAPCGVRTNTAVAAALLLRHASTTTVMDVREGVHRALLAVARAVTSVVGKAVLKTEVSAAAQTVAHSVATAAPVRGSVPQEAGPINVAVQQGAVVLKAAAMVFAAVRPVAVAATADHSAHLTHRVTA